SDCIPSISLFPDRFVVSIYCCCCSCSSDCIPSISLFFDNLVVGIFCCCCSCSSDCIPSISLVPDILVVGIFCCCSPDCRGENTSSLLKLVAPFTNTLYQRGDVDSQNSFEVILF